MNKDAFKIKYFLGLHKTQKSYPGKEDFIFEIQNWYYFKGGQEYIKKLKTVEMDGVGIAFSKKNLEEIFFDVDFQKVKELLSVLIKEGTVKVLKKTEKNVYFQLKKEMPYDNKH